MRNPRVGRGRGQPRVGWLLGLALFAATSTAWALDPARPLPALTHRVWSSESGLQQDTVMALLESRDGFLWIGTEKGLMRFDGAQFTHFSRVNTPVFAYNEVHCLAETPDGSLWVGTSEPGLYRVQKGVFTALGPSQGLPESPIRCLLRDREGTLWAAPTEGPLLRLVGGRFEPVPSDAARLRCRTLIQDSTGVLWVGTVSSGLWRVQQDRLVLAALSQGELTAVETGPTGQVYAGTRTQGLLVLKEGRLEPLHGPPSLAGKPITTLLMDREGMLWIGREHGGLARRTSEGRVEMLPGGQTAAWTVQSLMEDSAGSLWVGTEDRGLHLLAEVPFQAVPTEAATLQEPAWMVCQDRGGTVWCLTGDRTLGRLQNGKVTRVSLGGGLDRGSLCALWPRSSGGLWLGTQGGDILWFNGGPPRPLDARRKPQGDAVLSLYEDSSGSLWAGMARQGLLKFQADGVPGQIYPAEQGVVAMAGGGQNRLFLASRTRGFGIMEAGQVRWLGAKDGLGSAAALSLHLDGDGALWVGTQDGLRVYRDGGLHAFTDPQGIFQLAVHAITEDLAKRLWLSTSQGVLRVAREALLQNLEDASPVPFASFDHRDGLPSRETAGGPQPTACVTREGDLYVSTSLGLGLQEARYPPKVLPPLKVHLVRTLVDDVPLGTQDEWVVPPGAHRLEIHYTAVSLSAAEKVRFRYRLEGFDHIWNEAGERRFAIYSNLPPGRYRFQLEASRLGEDEVPKGLHASLQVLPLVHQRPAFWALLGLMALGFAWWLHRLRLQQLEARSAVLAERNRMAREIHDHLAQGFTGVMLQLEAAEALLTRMQGDAKPVLTRLDHARNLADTSLQEARRSVMTLRPVRQEGVDLLDSLRSLADRLLAGTEIQVELSQTGSPRALGGRLEEELLRMAQEAMTNALRHGHARWVRVVLQYEGRQVRLTIEDDGQGFDPSADAAGYGMRSIRESIRQFRGRLDVDSQVGLGSRITITLPIRRWRL